MAGPGVPNLNVPVMNLPVVNVRILNVPILKGKNYKIWSTKMQSILEHVAVWDAVETDTPDDDTRNKEARYFILNGLDDIVLGEISKTKSSKEAWKILKDKYTNESRINNNAALLFVAICAGFVLRLLFGDVPSDSGMQSFVLIEAFAMVLLIYVIYNVAGLKITNAQFAAMAIGAVLGMIVAISGPLLGASTNPARLAGSSISIYMILGAVLGAIYSDVITPPSVPPLSVATATTPLLATTTTTATTPLALATATTPLSATTTTPLSLATATTTATTPLLATTTTPLSLATATTPLSVATATTPPSVANVTTPPSVANVDVCSS